MRKRRQGREVLLPGPGIIGEYINSLLEIGLNMITVWMHGEAGSQCGRRLLCELNQKARSQSALHSALTYTGGLLLSLLLPEASPSDHLLAMRQGRRGADCLATFDRCQVTL
ncbi:hypothetical protein FJT64_002295 [Amphibalanus amphitrite]|uniref:Uncharacterized protein n=1 Tax=Amphibalanus amphitrite TaxID=1232801 RepID=A0A6A4WU61_AMPAM|nr:hypothetical protein FJT64_002295 [Amphibalanus amphitrite]